MKIFRNVVSLEKAMITKHMTVFFFQNGLWVKKKKTKKTGEVPTTMGCRCNTAAAEAFCI